MTMTEQIKAALISSERPLTEDEFEAVTSWINANKDTLPWQLKEGLLKLINAEAHRRM